MKYKLTDIKQVTAHGETLYRIQYADGAYGGWLESEDCLSQEGNCRVLDNAQVFNQARVTQNAIVCDSARISDFVRVEGNSRVEGYTIIRNYARVYGHARILGRSYCTTYGHAQVYGCALLDTYVRVDKNAHVCGNARVNRCYIGGRSLISGDTRIAGSNYLDFINVTIETGNITAGVVLALGWVLSYFGVVAAGASLSIILYLSLKKKKRPDRQPTAH